MTAPYRSPAQPFPHPFEAVLFDMDGTLLSSIVACERVWGQWARRHGLDVEAFLPTIHGRRSVDTVRSLNLPGVDAEVEAALITQQEIEDTDGIEAIPGIAAFLDALPAQRWAVVTSAPRALALRRIEAAGLPLPAVVVTSEDVKQGKPAPDCFKLAAQRLGVPVERCLVFEDAPAGITAGESAGATVVVVTFTHTHPLETAHRTVATYEGVRCEPVDGPGGALRIRLNE